MSSIRPFDDIPSLAPPPPRAQSQAELGQADFLKLMITQFQNQDPFKPMENGEFLGQIAQFSTVSGIDDLNSGFDSLATSIQDEQALKAASLVGRTVVAETNVGYLGTDRPLNGSVEIDGYVSAVQIDIKDSSGAVIQRLNLGEQRAGPVLGKLGVPFTYIENCAVEWTGRSGPAAWPGQLRAGGACRAR